MAGPGDKPGAVFRKVPGDERNDHDRRKILFSRGHQELASLARKLR
jgi:hypothetical protein